MSIIITGVAGFIGSTLAERLLAEGEKIIGIDSFTDYYSKKIKLKNLGNSLSNSNFKFIEGDLNSLDLKTIIAGAEYIYHQAGQAGVRKAWGNDFARYVSDNILATQKLLEAAKESKELKKFINASSSSVYGTAEIFPTPEDILTAPVSPYGVTKLAAENLATLYAKECGVPAISLRYFTVYGPRQRPDMAFNIFIRSILKEKKVKFFGDGKQTRSFTYIDDIIEGNILAAQKGQIGAVYNLGGGSQVDLFTVCDILHSHLGNFDIEFAPKVLGESRDTGACLKRATKDLGYAPRISLSDGIVAEIEWIQNNIGLFE
ncbi:MAG TPA: NAD-dependent epimerase/dehydratase family protein [Oligoflexia bacterium]|nr:NAD-dependent epimerase/dehydratase family protein [Oligoflexia bacterium]HMP27655.1 NAD-dependent epimerase/dehydratase family protein [Oligoflexia bacterium]